ncbi:pre-mRNA-splicing factor CWC22 homolog [Myzus persicae]|uniref:pre-mRNA-splicing factor CWC22 homolog n=1 Tax=Myzus persicae TaxID=13164 RepID=UPI000B932283|nr:pre-mRNA-splicing factor CWC22 homolog [Myzus persicae]
MNKLPPPPRYPSHLLYNSTRRRSVTYRYCPSAGAKKGISVLTAIPEYTVTKLSEEYQTTSWKILENSISNLVKQVNSESKAREIKKKIVRLNIVRGRGILCKSVMEAQLASTTNTHIYALFIALIYDEISTIGELILVRCLKQFRNASKTKEKCVYLASVLFISYLIIYDVVSPLVVVKLLKIFIKIPSQDSVDATFVLLNTCGYKLNEQNKKDLNKIVHNVHNKSVYNMRFAKKIRRMIQIIMRTISLKSPSKVKGPVISRPPLTIFSAKKINPNYSLDSYSYDPDYEANEEIYSLFRDQILENDIKDEYIIMYDHNTYDAESKSLQQTLVVKHTGSRKAIRKSKSLKDVLEILMESSSFKYENCASQLMKIKLNPGQEKEICYIFLELCCENDVYTENLGHMTQIFCQMNRLLIGPLQKMFIDTYAIVNSYDRVTLQNVAKYFAQLLYTDTISWMVLSTIRLDKIQTTRSTGNFVKHLFHELVKHMGEENLNCYIKDPSLKDAFEGIFFGNNKNHSNFSVDLFSSIGLDGLITTFQNSLIF